MSDRTIVIDGRIIFRPQCRGIGRAVIGLVERFPEDATDLKLLVQRGAESPFDLDRVAARAELVETDLSLTAPADLPRLPRLLRRLDAGVLYCPYHPFVPLGAPCPVVTTVHDCILEEDPIFAGGRLRQLGFEALTWWALRRSAAVTVPSEATARAVARHYPHAQVAGVASNGVSVRRPGDEGNATIEATRTELGLPDRYLLHVGARRPHKNQAVLVEALAHLDPSISLVLVGDIDPRVDDIVPATVERLGLGGRVLSLERVPDRYMAGLYGGAAAFVFPSLQEGYGIPPLEAMANGVPVIASAIPVMAEVCGMAALFVSPFDERGWAQAVEKVLADDQERAELVRRGHQTAAQATWERGGRALHDVLRQWSTAA